jgi:hypothetical protein
MEALRPFNGDINVIGRCPEASEPSGGWGRVNLAWSPIAGPGFLRDKCGGYAFNGWLYNKDVDQTADRNMKLGPAGRFTVTSAAMADSREGLR